MDLTVKIESKEMYNSFVQFFKSLGIPVVSSPGEKQTDKKQVKFKALKLKTKGKLFSRDEANER
jgi:ATP-dependent RNA circularization protein (DNA/RNA ligase family)